MNEIAITAYHVHFFKHRCRSWSNNQTDIYVTVQKLGEFSFVISIV